jgi:hypothetical protein
MRYLHPAIMLLALLLGYYALILGWPRFSTRHLGRRAAFAWNRHVLVGQLALGGIILGALVGLAYTGLVWGGIGGTGRHFQVGAYAILPLAVFAYAAGLRMHLAKAKRTILPPAHAAAAALVLLLALYQAWTGLGMLF